MNGGLSCVIWGIENQKIESKIFLIIFGVLSDFCIFAPEIQGVPPCWAAEMIPSNLMRTIPT